MNRVVNYSLARTRTLAWWNALPSRVRIVLTVLFTLAIFGAWVGWAIAEHADARTTLGSRSKRGAVTRFRLGRAELRHRNR